MRFQLRLLLALISVTSGLLGTTPAFAIRPSDACQRNLFGNLFHAEEEKLGALVAPLVGLDGAEAPQKKSCRASTPAG